MAQRESCSRLHCAISGPESLTVPKTKLLAIYVLSRLEEDQFSESRVGHATFFYILPATQVYFVIELAQAAKHEVGLASGLYFEAGGGSIVHYYLSFYSPRGR